MKKLLSILCGSLLLCGVGFTSCDDWDVPNTDGAYGNISIPEGRTISIKDLKEKYDNFIDTSSDTYTTITDDTRIEGVIIGDDESGNIYKQLVVADETGAIVVGVNTTGLYAFCPVGQRVVIDCKGLCIGSYRRLAQIGTLYEGKVGRMPEEEWKLRVRLIDAPSLNNVPAAVEIASAADLKALDMKTAPLLVTFKGVKFPAANGQTAYASKEDVSNPKLSFVEQDMRFVNGSRCDAMMHTSIYANFSDEKLPEGALNVTGVLTRYNKKWQLIVRTINDVEKIK